MAECRIRGDFWPPHIEIGCQDKGNRVYGLRLGFDQPYEEPLTGVSLSLVGGEKKGPDVDGISCDLFEDFDPGLSRGTNVTNGLNFSLFGNDAETRIVNGAQVGGVIGANFVAGAQIGFLAAARDVVGVQCAGVAVAEDANAQLAIVAGADRVGAQLAPLAISGEVDIQVGLVTLARERSPYAQIGIVRGVSSQDRPSLKIALVSVDRKTDIPHPTIFGAFLMLNPVFAPVGIVLDSLLPVDEWFSKLVR